MAAPLGQRLLVVFGLLAGLLPSLGLARNIDRDLVYSTDLHSILPRAPTTELEWPCLPDKRTPRKKVKDTGAEGGNLEYTAEMVKAANAEHADNATTSARHVNEDVETRTLEKRLGGAISMLYEQAAIKVPTDEGHILYWQWYYTNPEGLIIATNDLSGCAVIIVSSPHVVLMVHVLERRDEATWLTQPFGPAQKAKDAEFVSAGSDLMDSLLGQLGGSAANGYGGWLPPDMTTVHIVAPAENPEYDNHYDPNLYNPWYTPLNKLSLFYQDTTMSLLSMVTGKVGCHDQGEILTYRRRYSNDPVHRTDDRDKLAIVPYVIEGHTYVNLMWDDKKLKPIAQLN